MAVTTDPAFGPGPLRGLRVLVAEDSAFVAQELELILLEEGGRVMGLCKSVAEASHKLDQLRIDVILIDLELSDGFADALAQRARRDGIPYIIITGYRALPTNADEHAVDVLLKPIDRSHLVRLLARFAQ